MNAVVGQISGELIDDAAQFFAPMSADLVDGLIGQYQASRKRIEVLADKMRAEEISSVLHYFIEGNLRDERHSITHRIDQLFSLDGAISQLNADYWNRALRLTDVIDCMPQKRRDEWFEQIRNPQGKRKHRSDEYELPPLPEFEEETVRSTIGHLLSSREKFLAERVDGIFQALSRTHVTNQPQGFGKRMIIPKVFGYQTVGHINDLRCVIAKFMGRDEPKHCATEPVIRIARSQNGKWQTVDAGALRIRVYGGVGTAHLEVHPDMAWRLNAILASLHPMAIPAEFRERPKRAKKIKDFELFDKPLPFAVLDILAHMKAASKLIKVGHREQHERILNSLAYNYTVSTGAAKKQADEVLKAIGGVLVSGVKGESLQHWLFDYEPNDVVNQIVCSGRIPDHKSHQYYPTPESLAVIAAQYACDGLEPHQYILEPSAGIGNLADHLPKEQTTCIEISKLHCDILAAKGFARIQADFLKWRGFGLFDRVVMNPPYSEGRWLAHLNHAATMLQAKGKIVAILPASARGKDLLDGFSHEWSEVFSNEFEGTSVSVVILIASKI